METQASQKGKAVATETNSSKKAKSKIPEDQVIVIDDEAGNDTPNNEKITQIRTANKKGRGRNRDFPIKLRKMLEDPQMQSIISWNVNKESVIIWKKMELCTKVLPRFFKHNNLASFLHQLGNYGFKKMNPREDDPAEYACADFRGEKEKGVSSSNLRLMNLAEPSLEAKLESFKDEMDEMKQLLQCFKKMMCPRDVSRFEYANAKLEELKYEMEKINKLIMENKDNTNLYIDISNVEAEMEQLKGFTNGMKEDMMELQREQRSRRIFFANEHKKEKIRAMLEKSLANPTFIDKFTQLMHEKKESGSCQIAKKPRREEPQTSFGRKGSERKEV